MMIKNQSRSRNWNWKLVENMWNQTTPMQGLSLNSQLQLRNSWECVNVGLCFNLTLSPTEQHLLQTPRPCPLRRCFPLGRGRFVWSLPPSAWPCLSFFLLPLLFLHFCLKGGWLSQPACPTRLCCWAHSAWGEPSLLALKSFLTWWKPFVFCVSWWGRLVNYVEGALGSTLSPGWGRGLHKAATGSLPLSLQLMSGVRISRGIRV